MSFHKCLKKEGYLVKKSQLDDKDIKQIKKDLTVSPIVLKAYQEFVKPAKFQIFQESPNYFYLPRYYGIETFGPPRKTDLPVGLPMNLTFIYNLLPHQIIGYEKTLKTLKEVGGGVLQLPCGAGKCLSKGTQILLYDGTIKKVEDIVIGDQLMGDDSTPRNVLSLARGQEEMYEIQPIKGETWGCNKSHILSLKCSANWSERFTEGSILDIELNEFLNLPKSFRNRDTPLRLYKVPITFPNKEVDLDPYMLGYWLGDGDSCGSKITTMTPDIVEYFCHELEQYNLTLKQGHVTEHNYKITSGKYDTWSIDDFRQNYFTYCLQKYDLINNKHIPLDYKCNSRDVQLKVLAGLIDSDGYIDANCYEITQKCEKLADDIIFLCRSLGFAAKKICTNSTSELSVRDHPDDKYGKVSGIYYRCDIYGNGLEQIPVILTYKKARQLRQIKDPLAVGFSVKPMGIGDYYGFTIDGNGRFLLGDFTVTHNTACAIKLAIDLGGKTLIVVNKECLMDQWADSITKFTGKKARIGYIQQDKVDVVDKDFVITMLHSLCKKDYPKEIFTEFSLSVIDECHHLASEMFSNALHKIATRYMLGLSATPNRKDGLSHVFYKYLGKVCHSERRQGVNRLFVKRLKLTSNSPMYETLYMSNGIKNTVAMITNLAKYDVRTALIVEVIRVLMTQDRKILLLSGRRDHLEQLYESLGHAQIQNIHGKPITYGYYYGNQGNNKQKHKQMLQESAKCDVVLGTISIACLSDQTKYINYLTGEEMTLERIANGPKEDKLLLKFDPISGKFSHTYSTIKLPVISLNELTGQFELDKAINIDYTKSKQCYRITYDLGEIVASYDHQFYTQRGWVALEHITTSDYLVCDRKINIECIDIPNLSVDDCWLIGCLMGDGSLSQYRKAILMFINIDQEIISEVSRVLDKHEMKLVLRKGEKYKYYIQKKDNDNKTNYVPSWLRTVIERHNLGHKGIDKSFSTELMMLPDEKIAGLLGGLFDTDGTASCRTYEKKSTTWLTVCYNTSSYKLKNQTIFLLKRLGIQPTVTQRQMPTNNTMYCINITSSQLKLFGEKVDIRLPRKKNIVTEHLPTIKYVSSIFNRIPFEYVETIRNTFKNATHAHLKNLLKNQNLLYGCRETGINYQSYQYLCNYYKINDQLVDKCFIHIKAIDKLDNSDQIKLCDMTVDKNHNFLIGGILAHNSEGLDIPDLNTEILATPSTDVEQAVGRILRKFHDKINPIVVDLVDAFGNFSRQASVRNKFYKDEQYEVQDMKLPLGNDVRDLQPFLAELKDYLVSTSIVINNDSDDDNTNDSIKNTPSFGKCMLDDDVEQVNNKPKSIPHKDILPDDTNHVKKSESKSLFGKCMLSDDTDGVKNTESNTSIGKCVLNEPNVRQTKPKMFVKNKTITQQSVQADTLIKGKCLLDA